MHPTQTTLFRISMYWRMGYGVMRIVLACTLLGFLGQSSVDMLTPLFHYELLEDPHDALFSVLMPFIAHHPFNITAFIATYLAFWGGIDTFLSWHMLRYALWAFPVSIVLMSLFTLYELFRYTHTHSLMLLGIVFIDIGIIALVWREYRHMRTPHKMLIAG